MAKNPQKSVTITKRIEGKKHRKGIHAKTRHSSSKNSKFYVKTYRGQGK